MRLPRPYIPWSVREQVIDRQMAAAKFTPSLAAGLATSVEQRVRWKTEEFFAGRAVELHHRPALVNREIIPVKKEDRGVAAWHDSFRVIVRYNPDANDPAHLIYLPADEHDVETRVRGQRGQHSDLALARKRRRKERKLKRPKSRLRSRGFARRPPQRSASRPIRR